MNNYTSPLELLAKVLLKIVYLVGCLTSNHYAVANCVTIMPKSENIFYLEAKQPKQ